MRARLCRGTYALDIRNALGIAAHRSAQTIVNGVLNRVDVCILGGGLAGQTLARQLRQRAPSLDIVVLVAANHQYAILRNELRRGNATLGEKAAAMTSLDKPRIDWVTLAQAYGVPGSRVGTTRELQSRLQQAFAQRGPRLIEMAL